MPRFRATAPTLAIAATVAACSGGPALQTGALPVLPLSGHSSTIAAPPVDVYQRIATQSALCWFGPSGPLRHSHIFHAIAAAPADGGMVRISLHKRAPSNQKPWGAKAYEIALDGKQSTSLTFRNISVPLAQETVLKSAVLAWANGKTDCPPPPQFEGPPTAAATNATIAPTPPRKTRRPR